MLHAGKDDSANSALPCYLATLIATVVMAFASGEVRAAADAARGAKLATQWCNSCHSVSAEKRMADAGPAFAELAKKSPGYLATAINKPHDFMPKFPTLSDQDKQDLIAYIRTVK